MKKCLIKPMGFMGDALFAASAARKLKEEGQFDIVDLATGLKQVEELLVHDEWIDNIIRVIDPTTRPLFGYDMDGYDAQFELTETNKVVPPPTQAQWECGVRNPDTKFEITVEPEVLQQVKEEYSAPYIAYMNVESWKEKAFRFTKLEYERGVDVPYLGYGGRLRDIAGIVHRLQEDGFVLAEVGLKAGIKSLQATQTGIERGIVWDAAVIQNAEYFIGAEGGLANIAAAVHTTSVLTSEFVHQLYGYNGVMKKIVNPKLGPRFYWPEDGHIDLNPYLTDEHVANEMIAVFNGKKTKEEFDYAWCTPSV